MYDSKTMYQNKKAIGRHLKTMFEKEYGICQKCRYCRSEDYNPQVIQDLLDGTNYSREINEWNYLSLLESLVSGLGHTMHDLRRTAPADAIITLNEGEIKELLKILEKVKTEKSVNKGFIENILKKLEEQKSFF